MSWQLVYIYDIYTNKIKQIKEDRMFMNGSTCIGVYICVYN